MNRLPGTDRFLRFLFGILALQTGVFLLQGFWQTLAYAVGGLLLTTAVLNACPVYRVLGRQVCEVPGEPAQPQGGRTTLAVAVLLAVAIGGTWLGWTSTQTSAEPAVTQP